MGDDSTLQITARIDLGQFNAGLVTLGTGVQNANKQIATSADATHAVWERALGGMKDSISRFEVTTDEAANAQKRFGDSGIFAFQRVREQYIEATKRVAELRAELLATTDAQQRVELTAQLSKAQSVFTALRTEMRGMRLESAETTEKLNLLASSIGVRIPGEIGRLLARTPELQSVLSNLFSVAIIATFISAIGELIGKINEATEAFIGWDAAAKKTYEDIITKNREAVIEAGRLKEEHLRLSEIGKTGLAKLAEEQGNNQKATQLWGEELRKAEQHLAEFQAKKDSLSLLNVFQKNAESATAADRAVTAALGPLGAMREAYKGVADRSKDLKEVETSIRNQSELVDVLTKRVAKLHEEQGKFAPTIKVEEDREGFDNFQAFQHSMIENTRATAAERVVIETKVAEEARRLFGDTSKEFLKAEEAVLAARKATSEQGFQIFKASEEQRVIAAQAVGASLERLDQLRLESAEAIGARTAQVFGAGSLQAIAARTSVLNAQIKAAEDGLRAEQAVIAESLADTKRGSDERLQIRAAELSKLTVMGQQGSEAFRALQREQIAEIEAVREKMKAAADQITLGIIEGADKQVATMQRARDEDLRSEVQHVQKMADLQRQQIADLANLGVISPTQRIQAQQATLNAEREAEAKLISELEQMYQHDLVNFEKVEKLKTQLADQAAKQQLQITQQTQQRVMQAFQAGFVPIENGLRQMVNGFIQGGQTIRQTMSRAALGILESWADSMVQLLSKWVETHIAMAIYHQIFGQQQVASTAISSAQEHATKSAANFAGVVSDSGLAAATAYAYWAWNPPVAAAMAAQAAATTLAVGSPAAFASGGEVKGSGSSKSDSIHAMVSPGEFIVQAEAVNKLGVETLEAINRGEVPMMQTPQLSMGGPVGEVSRTTSEISRHYREGGRLEKFSHFNQGGVISRYAQGGFVTSSATSDRSATSSAMHHFALGGAVKVPSFRAPALPGPISFPSVRSAEQSAANIVGGHTVNNSDNSRGDTHVHVGGITVNAPASSTPQMTGKQIADELQKELRRRNHSF